MIGDKIIFSDDSGGVLVSVVVPSYNRATLIVDALDSVYAQSYRPLELVVVDDGSSDNTERVVAEWIGAHSGNGFDARYVCQKNMGGNVARNRGIRETAGEYVAFLDSDDLWSEDKLQLQMRVFDSCSCVGGVYCGLRHVLIESGEVLPVVKRSYPSGQLLSAMLVHDVTAPTSTYIIRREVFDKVGFFDEELQARQDWDMWIRLASSYKIGVVPQVLVDYREHAGERTASNPQKEITAYAQIMEKYAGLRARCPFAVRQAAKAAYCRRMGRVHFHHKISVAKAVMFQICSIISWPFVFDSYAALFGMMVPSVFRKYIGRIWNCWFSTTRFAIRSH